MVDAQQFAAHLRPLLPRSAGYAHALLGERRRAEDAVQQAALKAWEKRAHYDMALPFKPWWFVILRHQCLDMIRQHRRQPVTEMLDDHAATQPADESSFDRIALARAMEALSQEHREILSLRYHADLDYTELAALLGIPKGTVMSRLHLARKALAGLITKDEP